MVRSGRERLSGRVEVDETLIGGLRRGNPSRNKKIFVSIAAEIRGKNMGRIRLQQIPDDTTPSIKAFVLSAIVPGSELVTDGAHAYKALVPQGYLHDRTVLMGRGDAASSVALPRVHRVATLLKRWILGTHQGSVSKRQLGYYLDEFTFRFNRRLSQQRGMLFFRLLQQCVVQSHTPYRKIRQRS